MRALLRNRDARAIAFAIVAFLLFDTLSSLTGFDAWTDRPTGRIVIHLFAVPFMGLIGLAWLLWPYERTDMRPLFCRLAGGLFLSMAAIHLFLLATELLS